MAARPPSTLSMRSIQTRLAAVTAVAGSFILVIVSVMLLLAIGAETRWIDEQVMRKRVANLQDILLMDANGQAWLAHEVAEDLEGPRRVFIRILDAEGEIIQETPLMSALLRLDAFPDVSDAPEGVFSSRVITSSDQARHYGMSVRLRRLGEDGAQELATLQIAIDTSLDELALARYRGRLAWVVLLGLGLMAITSYWIARANLSPIRKMAHAVDQIDPAQLSSRLNMADTPLELDFLRDRFNLMLDRLQARQEQLRAYADNVAHEIRSPLQALILETDIVLLQERSSSQYVEAIKRQRADLTALADLSHRLLVVARIESGAQHLSITSVRADDLVYQTLESVSAAATTRDVTFEVEVGKDIAIEGDRTLLSVALANLLSNAIAHSPQAGRVRVTATLETDAVLVCVIDQGAGVPEEHFERIFDRFVRLDPSRDPSSGRVGLGLPIVRAIARLHGGTVHVYNAPRAGACFALRLPTALVPDRPDRSSSQAARSGNPAGVWYAP